MNSRTSQGIVGAVILSLMSICMIAGGCGAIRDMKRRKQLESVAKDWCYTIRASQVIPVYPLTEDLQVGDVFLVHTPAEKQHEEYKKRGFLPLEQLLVRLHPEGYSDFYLRSHDTAGRNNVPYHWRFPTTQPAAKGIPAPTSRPANWALAPRAGFPSYGFQIRQGQSFGLSVPIEGIPVAMSLLGAQTADCSVTIKDAYTYGIGTLDMERRVRRWSLGNREFLASFEPRRLEGCWNLCRPKERYYVRVITRVYLARTLLVRVASTEASALGVTAGLPTPASQPSPSTQPAETFAHFQRTLNENMAGMPTTQPGAKAVVRDARGNIVGVNFGASLRVVGASGGTIAIEQTFDRPLVIGYLAIDMPIQEAGDLGRRVSTLATLERRSSGRSIVKQGVHPRVALVYLQLLKQIADVLEERKMEDARARDILTRLNTLGRRIPKETPFMVYKLDGVGALPILKEAPGSRKITRSDFLRVKQYWEKLESAKKNIEDQLKLGVGKFKFDDHVATELDIARLKVTLESLRLWRSQFNRTFATDKAISDAVQYYLSLKGE